LQWLSRETSVLDGTYLEYLAKVIYHNSYATGNTNKISKDVDLFSFTENQVSKKSGSNNRNTGSAESTKDTYNLDINGTKDNSENENINLGVKAIKKKKNKSTDTPVELSTPSKPVFFSSFIGLKSKISSKSINNKSDDYSNLKLKEDDTITDNNNQTNILNARLNTNDKSNSKANKTKPVQIIQLVYS
jgi:hypothetical protein